MTRFGLFIVGLATLTAALGHAQGQGRKNPVVVMDTSQGKITIELFESKAPITVKNFLRYVDEKHFDGTIFHRVIPDFMIQGGGMGPGLKEKKTHDGIKNESTNGLSNERGTLAMARRVGEPDSATSQFFINVKDNVRLDKAKADDRVGYAVFGKVIDGMEVVDKIRRVETRTVKGATAADLDHEDVPVADVIIRSVRRK